MEPKSRRDFLADVGKGMLTASVGSALVSDLGLSALADTGGKRLEFGRLEPLVDLLQENSAEKMLPLVVDKLNNGVGMRDIVAAAALANARTFGGEDYIGFHAFMALAPAYEMTNEMPSERKALPVLKVLYRSTNQIQAKGGRNAEVLHPIEPAALPAPESRRDALREAVLRQDLDRAETLFAGLAAHSPLEAFNDVQALVQDETDVHRTVLAYRAWDLLGITGKEHALTTLRQSVHYCVDVEKRRALNHYPESGIRKALPKLVDTYKLAGRAPGNRQADDKWILSLCNTLITVSPEAAAEAVAAALADGFSLESIGEALSLGSTHRVIRDPGRAQAYPGKPIGSVHGDSTGVHASDSMNAWRNMAKASSHYNALTGLVVAGYHLAFAKSSEWDKSQPYSVLNSKPEVKGQDAQALLRELNGAIRENNQALASAIVQKYGEQGHAAKPVFAMLLQFATSEDGALHAEKYYRTVSEEFGRTRKAYRWDHLVALARVTASEYGKRADGYEQACGLLKVSV